MVQVTVEETENEHWGKCIALTNGIVDLVATLDVGPRIIRFGVVDGPNEFYEDQNDEIDFPVDPEFEPFGNEGNFHLRGGHRLWIAPEAMPRTYYPDNKPVNHTILKNGVRLTPPLQVWTQMQTELEIIMNEDGEVTVTHRVTNQQPWPIEFAPWAVTVMKVGGFEVVPQSKIQTGLLPNRFISLWPYSDMADSRVNWGTDYITLRPTAKMAHPFKFGVQNEHGYVTYFNHGNMFVKKYTPVENGSYPDGGVSYETYTNANVCEMETLGVLKEVSPGETVEHVETWQLIPNVPEPESLQELQEVIQEYIL